jgi:hypothetical protein
VAVVPVIVRENKQDVAIQVARQKSKDDVDAGDYEEDDEDKKPRKPFLPDRVKISDSGGGGGAGSGVDAYAVGDAYSLASKPRISDAVVGRKRRRLVLVSVAKALKKSRVQTETEANDKEDDDERGEVNKKEAERDETTDEEDTDFRIVKRRSVIASVTRNKPKMGECKGGGGGGSGDGNGDEGNKQDKLKPITSEDDEDFVSQGKHDNRGIRVEDVIKRGHSCSDIDDDDDDADESDGGGGGGGGGGSGGSATINCGGRTFETKFKTSIRPGRQSGWASAATVLEAPGTDPRKIFEVADHDAEQSSQRARAVIIAKDVGGKWGLGFFTQMYNHLFFFFVIQPPLSFRPFRFVNIGTSRTTIASALFFLFVYCTCL